MFCFVGFGTDRLRREEAMKTAGRENPNHGVAVPRNRAHGAAGQNRSCAIKWAAKQEKLQPKEMCFSLTSPFIELPECPTSSLLHETSLHKPRLDRATDNAERCPRETLPRVGGPSILRLGVPLRQGELDDDGGDRERQR